MKTLYTLTVFTLTIAGVFAQPVLTRNEMLPLGSIMELTPISNYSVINTSLVGENKTWDFSSLQADLTDTKLTVKIVDPSKTPQGAQYPNANYAYEENTPAIRYFNLSDSTLARVGSQTTSASYYTNPQVEYIFPLTYQSSNDDSWEKTSGSAGDYNIECVGYGTLKLPGVTYENALMVYVYVEELFLTMDVYFWYSSDNGAILLEYIEGDGFWTSDYAQYLSKLTVATGIEERNIVGDIKYNNPVNNELRVSFTTNESATFTYDLINNIGQLINSGVVNSESLSSHEINLDFTNIPKGLYFLKLKSDDASHLSKTIKLIKQ